VPAGPPGYIYEVLKEAERLAGLSSSGFRDRVMARLEKGASEYGPEGYRERPIEELFEEIAEEARDLAGWSALTLDALWAHPPETRRVLLEIAALAGQAERLLYRVRAGSHPVLP
jgi:hypothetical protein